jgi:small-conductance mechanosensitive channel
MRRRQNWFYGWIGDVSILDRLTEILGWTIFSVGDTTTTFRAFLAAMVVLFITFLLSKTARKVVNRAVHRIDGHDDSSKVVGVTVSLVIWIVGIEIVLHLLGFQLTTLFAASGFLALGAGFAVKNIVENFLSGVILRMEKTIRKGDIIVVSDQWLCVSKIAMRTTRAESFDGEDVLIPNSIVAQSMVTNLTRRDRLHRLTANLGVSYESDLKLVRQTLEVTIASLEWASAKRTGGVYLHEFGDSSVNYRITVWLDDIGDTRERTSELLEAIWWALKEKGITIAFPQLDVHLDGPAPDSNSGN